MPRLSADECPAQAAAREPSVQANSARGPVGPTAVPFQKKSSNESAAGVAVAGSQAGVVPQQAAEFSVSEAVVSPVVTTVKRPISKGIQGEEKGKGR